MLMIKEDGLIVAINFALALRARSTESSLGMAASKLAKLIQTYRVKVRTYGLTSRTQYIKTCTHLIPFSLFNSHTNTRNKYITYFLQYKVLLKIHTLTWPVFCNRR